MHLPFSKMGNVPPHSLFYLSSYSLRGFLKVLINYYGKETELKLVMCMCKLMRTTICH